MYPSYIHDIRRRSYMAKFFYFLAFIFIFIALILQRPEFSRINDILPLIVLSLLFLVYLCLMMNRYFGVKLAPLKMTRGRVLKTHIYYSCSITVLLPNNKKLKLSGISHAMANTLKKGDLVYIEYKGWEVVKIKKVELKDESKK